MVLGRSARRGKISKGPWLWPLVLALIGIVLLFHNFLLLGDFNVLNLWPLLLVVFGAQILLRGDITPNEDVRTFGITRGSVESATLEISSGSVDIAMRALRRDNQERLIAGQFAPLSRPRLNVDGVHATLSMLRSQTPWYAFADWEMGLARDLPWGLFVTTHLGQVNCDLSELVIQEAVISTGIGDVRLVCPPEAFGQIHLFSTLGNIHIITPPGYRSQITVDGGRMFGINVDDTRYEAVEEGVFVARDADEDAPTINLFISGRFGDAYLA